MKAIYPFVSYCHKGHQPLNRCVVFSGKNSESRHKAPSNNYKYHLYILDWDLLQILRWYLFADLLISTMCLITSTKATHVDEYFIVPRIFSKSKLRWHNIWKWPSHNCIKRHNCRSSRYCCSWDTYVHGPPKQHPFKHNLYQGVKELSWIEG